MKNTSRSLLVVSVLLVAPQMASASFVLAGFNKFTNDASTQEHADQVAAGYSGLVTKTTASININGSTDGIYGSMDAGEDTNHVTTLPNNENGAARLENTSSSVIFSVKNNTGVAYTLETLLFDAARELLGKTSYGQVSYRTYTSQPGDDYDLLKTYSVSWPATATNPNPPPATLGTDYVDFAMDLLGLNITLTQGMTIDFRFMLDNSHANDAGYQYIDNVATTGLLIPIPEPGSWVALGCLVGSGVFLRSRRRD